MLSWPPDCKTFLYALLLSHLVLRTNTPRYRFTLPLLPGADRHSNSVNDSALVLIIVGLI